MRENTQTQQTHPGLWKFRKVHRYGHWSLLHFGKQRISEHSERQLRVQHSMSGKLKPHAGRSSSSRNHTVPKYAIGLAAIICLAQRMCACTKRLQK